jgi:hypothetical protein
VNLRKDHYQNERVQNGWDFGPNPSCTERCMEGGVGLVFGLDLRQNLKSRLN